MQAIDDILLEDDWVIVDQVGNRNNLKTLRMHHLLFGVSRSIGRKMLIVFDPQSSDSPNLEIEIAQELE